jgi:hypothetical protein
MLRALPRVLIHAMALIAGIVTTASAEDAPVRFVSPVDGQVVRPGETIAIVLEVDPASEATWAYVRGRMDLAELGEFPEGFKGMSGPPFETTFTVPRDHAGPTILFGRAFLDEERSVNFGGAEVALMVIPADPPISIVTMQEKMHFRLSSSPSEPERIAVIGEYIDGVDLDLDDPALGTTFESSDMAVAIVDERGNVRGVAPGMAVITVQNGGATAWVAVSVDDHTDRRVPPIDQTAKVAVSGSGFRVDPVSELFTQQVTVVNRSQEPLVRPLVLVLDELTLGVTVRSQVTRELHPVGAPWVQLTEGKGVLAPGASVTIDVQFRNPQGVPISYTPIVYSARHPI